MIINIVYFYHYIHFFIFVIYSLIPEINLFSLHGKMNNKRYRIFELFWKADRGKY